MINEIDAEKFNQLIKGEKPVVCDFFATWCGPCKMLAPVMEEIAPQFPQAEFVKVNIDSNFELAATYGIMSIPFVAVFKNGEMAEKSVGYSSKSEMIEFLKQNL